MTDFRTLIFQGASAEVLDLQAQLERAGSGSALAADALDAATFSVRGDDGIERLGPALNLGPLAPLLAQLEAVRDRLARGLPALLRSGVADEDPGLYLLFEPTPGGRTVALSMLAIDGIGNRSPVPAEGDDAAVLYRALAEHRDAFLQKALPWYGLAGVALDAAALHEAIERDLASGRQLVGRLAKG